jgi:hypothetical protein
MTITKIALLPHNFILALQQGPLGQVESDVAAIEEAMSTLLEEEVDTQLALAKVNTLL